MKVPKLERIARPRAELFAHAMWQIMKCEGTLKFLKKYLIQLQTNKPANKASIKKIKRNTLKIRRSYNLKYERLIIFQFQKL